MIYRVVWTLCWFIYRLLMRARIEGTEYVPKRGAYILAGNHISNLDPPLVAISLWRPHAFMAKEELFRKRWFAWLITRLHAYPVRRGAPDRNALKRSYEYLERGFPVVIFPEGTRSETGELQPAEMGVGMIAYRSGVPVIPFYLWGTREVTPREGGIRLSRVGLRYGPPLEFRAEMGRKPGREEFEQAAERIMAAVAELRDQVHS